MSRKRTLLRNAVLVSVTTALLLPILAVPAQAATTLTVSVITWDVVGLDSNNVNVGPNLFPMEARVCNTGAEAATNVEVTGVWDTSNGNPSPYIDFQTGSPTTLTWPSLGIGVCRNFYFTIEVDRNACVRQNPPNACPDPDDDNWYRYYHIEASADNAPSVSTGTGGRYKANENLISQSRNEVRGITGPCTTGTTLNAIFEPTTCAAPQTTLYVGSQYVFTLFSKTAPGGYEQLTTYLQLPNVIFRIDNVSQQYETSGAPYTATDSIYANGCGGWVYSNNYTAAPTDSGSCPGVGKSGDRVRTQFTVTIIDAPAVGSYGTNPVSVQGLIYDFSGSSFHYNADHDDTPCYPDVGYAEGDTLGGFDGPKCVDFTILEPTSVTFQDAAATSGPDGNAITWQTADESRNLGFNVYAHTGDEKIKVNDGLIAGQALQTADALGGDGSYAFVDPDRRADSYSVEAVDIDGATQSHGPVSVEGSTDEAATASRMLGAPTAADEDEEASSLAGRSQRKLGKAEVGSASLAGSPGLKVGVDEEGWYEVPLADVAAAGVDVSDPRRLRLIADGVEQAPVVDGDSVRFYGVGSSRVDLQACKLEYSIVSPK